MNHSPTIHISFLFILLLMFIINVLLIFILLFLLILLLVQLLTSLLLLLSLIALRKVISTFRLLQRFYNGVILTHCAKCVCNFVFFLFVYCNCTFYLTLSYCSFLIVHFILCKCRFVIMSKYKNNESQWLTEFKSDKIQQQTKFGYRYCKISRKET